ncbi:transgelin-2-like [Styela clava]
MASRPKGFGLTRETDEKLRAKYLVEDEQKIAKWIHKRTGREFTGRGQDEFRDFLMDGHVLCALYNSFKYGKDLKPNDGSKVKLQAMRNMKESENIEMFLKAAEGMGMKRLDMFQTVNIRDNQNMSQVLSTLLALANVAKARGVDGDLSIATKIAQENPREFDEQTQREGRNIIGLQMGTNQGASQAGMTGYGAQRQINHKSN